MPWEKLRKVVVVPRPGRHGGWVGDAPDLDRREAVDLGAGVEVGALLDDRARRARRIRADHAVVAHDGAGLDDGCRRRCDSRGSSRPDRRSPPSSMTRSLSGSRCSTVFSRICTSLPMRTGPCESPMIFTPAPMIVRSPMTTSPVISGGREEDRRRGDGRDDAAVRA